MHPWLCPGHLHRMDAPALPRRGGAAGSGRCRRDAGAPETRERGRRRRLERAGRRLPGRRGREVFTGADPRSWRGSGRGEPCGGTSSIYRRPARSSLSHARTQSTEPRRCPLRSLPPLFAAPPPAPPGSAPDVPPRPEQRRRHRGATSRPPPPPLRPLPSAFRGVKSRAAAAAPPEGTRTAGRRREWKHAWGSGTAPKCSAREPG